MNTQDITRNQLLYTDEYKNTLTNANQSNKTMFLCPLLYLPTLVTML